MALVRFKASPLPNAPATYDPQYIRQVIRVLEIYFSQLDSLTPNQAQSYTADQFIGGDFSGGDIEADSVETGTLTAISGSVDSLASNAIDVTDLDADAIHNNSLISNVIMAGDIYAGRFFGDGRHITTSYNEFISTADQTAAAIDQAYAVTYTTTNFPDGITLASSSRITFAKSGIYSITYSIQLQNTINGSESVDIWLRYKGTDIVGSNSRFGIPPRKSAGVPAELIAVTPLLVNIAADGDYVELMWRVSDTGVAMKAYSAVAYSAGVTPAIPSTPSVIVSVAFVSAQFPITTYVAPLPVFGFGQIGTITVRTP
jgi:hypothetical protein